MDTCKKSNCLRDKVSNEIGGSTDCWPAQLCGSIWRWISLAFIYLQGGNNIWNTVKTSCHYRQLANQMVPILFLPSFRLPPNFHLCNQFFHANFFLFGDDLNSDRSVQQIKFWVDIPFFLCRYNV